MASNMRLIRSGASGQYAADDVLVERLAGAQAQPVPARVHRGERGGGLRDHRGVPAEGGRGDAGAHVALGALTDRGEHAPHERGLALGGHPRLEVVGRHHAGEAVLLRIDRQRHRLGGGESDHRRCRRQTAGCRAHATWHGPAPWPARPRCSRPRAQPRAPPPEAARYVPGSSPTRRYGPSSRLPPERTRRSESAPAPPQPSASACGPSFPNPSPMWQEFRRQAKSAGHANPDDLSHFLPSAGKHHPAAAQAVRAAP